jgi:hypothetical protein
MKAFTQLERMKKMNWLIKTEHTGNPKEFAGKLGICQSHLYNLIEDMKIDGAPIKYSRKRQTYFYERHFEIKLPNSLYFIDRDQST